MTTRLAMIDLLLLACASAALAGCTARSLSSSIASVGPGAGQQDVTLRAADATDDESALRNALQPYTPVGESLAGKITSVGSSTTSNLLTLAAVEYHKMYPGVSIQITSGLSSIAPPALLEGKSDFAAMSRAMSDEEVAAFRKKFGYPPTEIRIAADAIAIYVEKSNPISSFTLQQLDGILSRTQRRGGPRIDTWGEAGVRDARADRHINLYGFAPGAAANDVVRGVILQGGEFRLSMQAQPVDSSVVQAVAADPWGLGFASVFFSCRRVRAVPIIGPDGRPCEATEANIYSGEYPLTRFLSVYVNHVPGRPLDRAEFELIRYLLSRDGQQLITTNGYMPIDAATAAEQLKSLQR